MGVFLSRRSGGDLFLPLLLGFVLKIVILSLNLTWLARARVLFNVVPDGAALVEFISNEITVDPEGLPADGPIRTHPSLLLNLRVLFIHNAQAQPLSQLRSDVSTMASFVE